jgi:hypothetical protein
MGVGPQELERVFCAGCGEEFKGKQGMYGRMAKARGIPCFCPRCTTAEVVRLLVDDKAAERPKGD